uniref:BTB domain-containing protein n=2 Tax=Panagrellus redivivus TaxID=6233 RepID=A0A7E5A0F8_PANRE
MGMKTFDGHLETCKELPDVTLIIDDTEFPAHRSILSKHSEYFKAMFSLNFIESNSDKITLKETNLKAFKIVLKYMYTGDYNYYNITIYENFQLHTCAKYFMVDALVQEVNRYLQSENPSLILNEAIAYGCDEIVSLSTERIQNNVFNLIVNKVFDYLSPTAVEHLLKVRLHTEESVIFAALIAWMQSHLEYSFLFPKLLNLVDLYLLHENHEDILFQSRLIEPDLYYSILENQKERASEVQKAVNQNVINGVEDLRIVDGACKVPRPQVISANPVRSGNRIVIDLKQQFLLNCLKLKLKNETRYTVSVSRDMRRWEPVKCQGLMSIGQQKVVFKEQVVRFIRIEASHFLNPRLKIHSDIEALYLTKLK